MGKLIWLAIAVLAWFYGSGYFAFSESGVNDFLNHWADSTLQGDAEAVCATAARKCDTSAGVSSGAARRTCSHPESTAANRSAAPRVCSANRPSAAMFSAS